MKLSDWALAGKAAAFNRRRPAPMDAALYKASRHPVPGAVSAALIQRLRPGSVNNPLQACYVWTTDQVFAGDAWGLLHEAAHWTGHPRRLDRRFVPRVRICAALSDTAGVSRYHLQEEWCAELTCVKVLEALGAIADLEAFAARVHHQTFYLWHTCFSGSGVVWLPRAVPHRAERAPLWAAADRESDAAAKMLVDIIRESAYGTEIANALATTRAA